ncbi:MAG: MBL fold metallo-hydrolase [Saprospiraceae bacterium]|nr:MBL fold metallo-hydrolase [Saprospiraceae bacterium]
MKGSIGILVSGVFFVVLSGLPACHTGPKKPSQEETNIEKEDPVDAVQLEYIAHASFILTHSDYSILIDPFADTVWISYFFPRDIKADVIFSTHPHYDHDGGIFRDLQPYWQNKIPFYQDPGEYTMGPFSVTGIKGKHCDPYGKEFGQKNTIFIFEAAGLRIAHWGDNGPINDTIAAALADVQVLLLPIDDEYHILKAAEIDLIIETLQPRIVVPMHHKIAQLEPTPGKPKNLGTIDNYFRERKNVHRIQSNKTLLTRTEMPDEMTYYIFQHAPTIH